MSKEKCNLDWNSTILPQELWKIVQGTCQFHTYMMVYSKIGQIFVKFRQIYECLKARAAYNPHF